MKLNAVCPMHTPKVTCGETILQEWHVLTRDHTVLPATHAFIHEWNEPTCIHFVSIHQMAHPSKTTHIWISLLLIYRPQKD